MAWKLVFCIICFFIYVYYFLCIAGQRAKEALRSVQPPCFLAGVPELMEILKCQEQSCLQVPQDRAKTFAFPMAGRNQRQTALCSKVILSWSSTKMREGPCNCLMQLLVNACWCLLRIDTKRIECFAATFGRCCNNVLKDESENRKARCPCHQRKPPI